MAENLEVDDVVTITNPKCPDFFEKQGVIVEIQDDGNKDGSIGVQFPPWKKYLFQYPDGPDTIVRFEKSDLRKDERLILPDHEQTAELLFRGLAVWEVRWPKMPLVPGRTECMHEGCEKKAWFEAWVNIWGVVHIFYVCGDHASYHGKATEDFPEKEPVEGQAEPGKSMKELTELAHE